MPLLDGIELVVVEDIRPNEVAEVLDGVKEEKHFESGEEDVAGAPHAKFLIVSIEKLGKTTCSGWHFIIKIL